MTWGQKLEADWMISFMLPVSRKSATVANSPHIHTLFLSSLPSCSCSGCFGPTGWLLIEHPLKTCSVEAWQDGCANKAALLKSEWGCRWGRLRMTASDSDSPPLTIFTYIFQRWLAKDMDWLKDRREGKKIKKKISCRQQMFGAGPGFAERRACAVK